MLVLYDYCNEFFLLVMEDTIVYGESFEALLLRYLQPIVQFYVEVEVGTCLLVAPLFANKWQMTIPSRFIYPKIVIRIWMLAWERCARAKGK